MANTCPICGKQALVRRSGEYRFEPPDNIPGGTIVISEAKWEECKNCNETILSEELELSLEKERYKRLGLLSPEEIHEIRLRTGLNQTEMADLLDIGEKTYTRWESGRALQNKSSDNLIRLVDMNADLFIQLKATRSPDRDIQIYQYLRSLPSLKGKNPNAIAAHGGEIDSASEKALCEKIRSIIELKRKFKN